MRSTDVNGEDGEFFKKDDLIYAYTREQAIADGELIDVSEMAIEAGFVMPVAITRAAWDEFVAWTVADTQAQRVPQDEDGRLWDVLWMLRVAIRNIRTQSPGANGLESEILFRFHVVPRDGSARSSVAALAKAVCGPIGPEDPRPCITIMKSDED